MAALAFFRIEGYDLYAGYFLLNLCLDDLLDSTLYVLPVITAGVQPSHWL